MARVLLVGKGLPDRGGIASFLRILLESSLSEEHDVCFLNIAHSDVPQGGRFTIANVTRTTRDAVSVWRAARGRDVVHIHSGAGSPVTITRAGILATAGRLRGCRVVVHAHGGRIQLWLTTRPRRAFARFVLRPANVVIAVSQGTRDALEGSVPAGRLLLIENGIVVDDFGPPGPWHAPPRLLYVGVLTPRKGVLDLLAASANLRRRGFAHEVHLVGGTPDEGPEAEAEVRTADDGHARFHGAQPPETMAGFYRDSDVFCLPSWWEAMPLSLLEAMASGLAVVASDVGDVARVVGDDGAAGIVVRPRSADQLTLALEQLLADPEEARRMGAAARARVEECFSFDRTARAIDAVYRGLTPSAQATTSRRRVPRTRRASSPTPFDVSVPVVVIKVGRYPIHHGGVGAIRSLGRVGVPTYAMVESRYAPAATSRYVTGRHCLTLNASRPIEELLAGLVGIGQGIGRPAIALPTDDEAAVLIAEHAEELSRWFITPNVEPGLPARLASKRGLRDLCLEHGVPTPAAAFPMSFAQIEEFGENATFPVIAKCAEPWLRLGVPALRDPRIIRSRRELLAFASEWGEAPNVALQEYLPRADSVDWIFGGYFNAQAEAAVFGTALKYRSWPPDGGPTAFARVIENDRLAVEATRFCRAVGYRGIVDMDWRYDRRDDKYKLIDCNPRIGAQFRLLENDAGIDFARALHLGLTNRNIPRGHQQIGRGFSAEQYDLRAVVAYRRMEPDASPAVRPRGHVELGWLSWDDPLPFAAMGAYSLGRAADRIRRRVRRTYSGRSTG